jgi:rhomboid protease GluP
VLTRFLLFANIIVFVWTTLHDATASPSRLVAFGAFYGPAIDAGQWWRAFTAAFVHDGFLHITFNMIALWWIGKLVEQLFGSIKMALIYIISILGSAWAIYHFDYLQVTIGASGAIFGLFGALAAAGLRLGPLGRQLLRSTVWIVVINILIGFTVPNISMAGHMGGLVAGFLAGFPLFVPPRRRRPIFVQAQHEGDAVEAELLPPRNEQSG